MIRLRDYRLRAGMTLKELGDKVGASESAISLYELGKREPKYEMLLKLAEALDTDVAHLLGTAEDDDPDLAEYIEELRTRPEMRMLFQTSKGMTKEQVDAVVAMLEGFKKNS